MEIEIKCLFFIHSATFHTRYPIHNTHWLLMITFCVFLTSFLSYKRLHNSKHNRSYLRCAIFDRYIVTEVTPTPQAKKRPRKLSHPNRISPQFDPPISPASTSSLQSNRDAPRPRPLTPDTPPPRQRGREQWSRECSLEDQSTQAELDRAAVKRYEKMLERKGNKRAAAQLAASGRRPKRDYNKTENIYKKVYKSKNATYRQLDMTAYVDMSGSKVKVTMEWVSIQPMLAKSALPRLWNINFIYLIISKY